MKLREIKIEKRFVPEWNKNRELPVDEQIVIWFSRIPGSSEREGYKGVSYGTADHTIKLNFNDNMMCATFVQKIENLEIGDKKIKDGKDLATAVHPKLPALFTEIRDYLFPNDEEFSQGESEA